MKIRSITTIIGVLPILFGFVGNACCPETEVYYTSLTGIQVESINSHNSSLNMVGDTTFIRDISYGLHIRYDIDGLHASVLRYNPCALYATEPCQPFRYYFSENITGIKVASTQDLDINHPKGSSLNDVFTVKHRFGIDSFEALLSDLNESSFFEDPQTDLLLNDSTVSQRVHSFIVTFEMENGSFISDTTSLVYLSD